MASFGMTTAGRIGRLRVMASRVISIPVLRMTPYNSIAERVRAIASRIRLPEGGNAIERYMTRMKKPAPATAVTAGISLDP